MFTVGCINEMCVVTEKICCWLGICIKKLLHQTHFSLQFSAMKKILVRLPKEQVFLITRTRFFCIYPAKKETFVVETRFFCIYPAKKEKFVVETSFFHLHPARRKNFVSSKKKELPKEAPALNTRIFSDFFSSNGHK